MNNTSSTKKVWILLALLVVSIGFWLWSREYLLQAIERRDEAQKVMQKGKPLSDEELDNQIDLTLDQSIELEIKEIEKEF
jgi:flagellar biosynthesis/type III secretory pathway M-ring protein FliF/YscJ